MTNQDSDALKFQKNVVLVDFLLTYIHIAFLKWIEYIPLTIHDSPLTYTTEIYSSQPGTAIYDFAL